MVILVIMTCMHFLILKQQAVFRRNAPTGREQIAAYLGEVDCFQLSFGKAAPNIQKVVLAYPGQVGNIPDNRVVVDIKRQVDKLLRLRTFLKTHRCHKLVVLALIKAIDAFRQEVQLIGTDDQTVQYI